MEGTGARLLLAQAEGAELGQVRRVRGQLETERREYRGVEPLALFQIPDAQVNVVEHQAALSLSRHSGSKARSRCTRSAIDGCVENMAARPTGSNGFTV
jgi:hypothetical protein